MIKQNELPEPSLNHLKHLTDDTGLFQHAKFTTPLRSEGYATDDNARALIVAAKHYALYHEPETLQLLDRYLAFLLHAYKNDGTIRNFMNFDRTWVNQEPTHDALGRTLWAFGALLAQSPSSNHVQIVKEPFEKSAPLIKKQSIRGMAYSILGLAGYFKLFPDNEKIRRYMKEAAETLAVKYEENSQNNWSWFEDILTYDNAMLPCALFTAAKVLNDKKYLDVAKKTCDFLLSNTYTGSHFSFVGCQGWFPRNGKKAKFDQQPIEAAGTVLMLKSAYQATEDKKFLLLQGKAFGWFCGENDLGIPLYDAASKGCGDGLGAGGVSANEGAESTLSYLLSLLTIIENNNSPTGQ